MSTQKRYIITYKESYVDEQTASQILGVPTESVKEGKSFMASDSVPNEGDVVHFAEIGASTAELNEEHAEYVRSQEGVLAVEEDLPAYALELDAEQQAQEGGAGIQTAYDAGYADALEAIYQQQQHHQQYQQQYYGYGQGFPAFTPPFPPQPFPPLPFPPQPFPPLPPRVVLPFPPIHPFPPVFVPLLQPRPWNITRVNAPGAWSRGITGTGIKVGVLDTGIANHPDLVISGGVSMVPGVVSYNDGNSHGTHCAGIIGARNNGIGVVGVAPNCNLYAVKVLSDAGSGMTSWIIAGMDWSLANGMHVISMSLGGENAPSVAYATAVKRLQDRGIIVVIASGNSHLKPFKWVCSPANSIMQAQPNASPIAVGSVDINNVIAASSSRGGQNAFWNQVTVVAPGVSINSTVPGGGYALKSGTSMACPHVAGLAALLKQRFPGINVPAAKAKITSTCMNLGPAGYDQTYGHGLINCNTATL
jgi:subtilisin